MTINALAFETAGAATCALKRGAVFVAVAATWGPAFAGAPILVESTRRAWGAGQRDNVGVRPRIESLELRHGESVAIPNFPRDGVAVGQTRERIMYGPRSHGSQHCRQIHVPRRQEKAQFAHVIS